MAKMLLSVMRVVCQQSLERYHSLIAAVSHQFDHPDFLFVWQRFYQYNTRFTGKQHRIVTNPKNAFVQPYWLSLRNTVGFKIYITTRRIVLNWLNWKNHWIRFWFVFSWVPQSAAVVEDCFCNMKLIMADKRTRQDPDKNSLSSKYLLLFPSRGARTQILSGEFRINQADYTDWMSFLPPNLMEEISPDPEAFSTDAERLSSAWNRQQGKSYLLINTLIKPRG